MPTIPFDRMPGDARLWIFPASRELTPAETERLLARVDAFLPTWNAHGHPVVGARELRHGRFLLIAADERATGVSGCSGDALFRVLKEAEREMGVTLTDAGEVQFRTPDGTILTDSRGGFRQRVARGEDTGETPVFDNTASAVAAVRGSGWERPMRESWHARAFAARA